MTLTPGERPRVRSIMEFLELVKRRESCRSYTGEPVSDADLKDIVEAGRLAPSACNSQPWKFYVVGSGGERMEKMRAAAQIAGNNKFAAKASAFIVVFREKPNYSERVGQVLFGREFSAIDIGLAVENIVLAATEKGLGTCILGMFTESAVKECIGLGKRDKRKHRRNQNGRILKYGIYYVTVHEFDDERARYRGNNTYKTER